jgi:hypothetical protein
MHTLLVAMLILSIQKSLSFAFICKTADKKLFLNRNFAKLYQTTTDDVLIDVETSSTEEVPTNRTKRILSGVQPTGVLHLGNYLGAIRQWVINQENYDNYFCVVDLHAITVPHDPKKLKQDTLQSAAMYIACGIDPAKSKIFVQSHVRAHAELTWLLNCITPMNWLERMIQFKEKAIKQGVFIKVFSTPAHF